MGDIFVFLMYVLLMIIYDLHVICIPVVPPETNAPLIIDPDAVLSKSLPAQCFQPVSRRDSQRVEIRCRINHPELAHRHSLNVMRQLPRIRLLEYLLGVSAPKRLDHGCNITRGDNNVKRYSCLHGECPHSGQSISAMVNSLPSRVSWRMNY